jgi:hypothetical protein
MIREITRAYLAIALTRRPSENQINVVKSIFGDLFDALTREKILNVSLEQGHLWKIMPVCFAGESIPFDGDFDLKAGQLDALAKTAAPREKRNCR